MMIFGVAVPKGGEEIELVSELYICIALVTFYFLLRRVVFQVGFLRETCSFSASRC